MALTSVQGPFRPGPGGMPPYLAGRETEQSFFRELLRDLANRVPPASEVVLYGPRGNGKTVLLVWLMDEARVHPDVEVVRLTPSRIPDRTRLAEELLPESWWKRLAPSEISVAGIGWRPGDDRAPSTRAVLAARAAKTPLILLLDEAHTLDPDVGRELLNASQEVGRELPFLLVLAGTPNLQGHLNRMGVSFWNRAEQMRVGRLGAAAAAEALRRPFEADGIACGADAAAAMARASQGYPYFVQLLGRAVWRQVVPPGGERHDVTLAALDAASLEFDRRKGEYYVHRLEELRNRRLFRVGRAVADAFAAREVVGVERLEGAIEAGLGGAPSREEVERAAETLGDLGYIWRVEGRLAWEPGIPSLLDTIREHVPAN